MYVFDPLVQNAVGLLYSSEVANRIYMSKVVRVSDLQNLARLICRPTTTIPRFRPTTLQPYIMF